MSFQANIFDFTGPEFLIIYLIIGFLTLFIVSEWIKNIETAYKMPQINMMDTYEISYLRGGIREVILLTLFSLIDRDLLSIKNDNLLTKDSNNINTVRRSLEKIILKKYISAGSVHDIYNDSEAKLCVVEFQQKLEKLHLLSSKDSLSSRTPAFIFGIVVIFGLAFFRIYISLQNGHHNLLFLIGLVVLFSILLHKIFSKSKTYLGEKLLGQLDNLFSGLKYRGHLIKPGGKTNEATVAVAVFGISILSSSQFPFIYQIMPKINKSNNSWLSNDLSDSSSSIDFDCSSSCSGGCGSGCGGCGGD